jgi:hypothetical protein
LVDNDGSNGSKARIDCEARKVLLLPSAGFHGASDPFVQPKMIMNNTKLRPLNEFEENMLAKLL